MALAKRRAHVLRPRRRIFNNFQEALLGSRYPVSPQLGYGGLRLACLCFLQVSENVFGALHCLERRSLALHPRQLADLSIPCSSSECHIWSEP